MKSEKQSLSSRVHDSILEMIIDAGAGSENMLLTESALVDRFGVSKAPVREALLRLCAEDVLTSIPRCGYVVVRLGEKSGRDNLIVRTMLETSSLQEYFDLYTPEILDRLDDELLRARQICREDRSIWTVWQQNMAFHCSLIGVSGNPCLVQHLTRCIEVERRYYAQNHFSATRRFEDELHPEAHENILTAIRRGDKPLALELLRRDIRFREEIR